MRSVALPILLSGLLAITPIAFAGPMQAGLWELTMKSDAFKAMSGMSAEEAAQLKKMGINVPQIRDGSMVSRICVTPEMAKREQPPMEQLSNCQAWNTRKNGYTYTTDVVCNGPEFKGKGVVKATYDGGTSFYSTYTFRGTVRGQQVNQTHESTGKWLGADCGSVRPPAGM